MVRYVIRLVRALGSIADQWSANTYNMRFKIFSSVINTPVPRTLGVNAQEPKSTTTQLVMRPRFHRTPYRAATGLVSVWHRRGKYYWTYLEVHTISFGLLGTTKLIEIKTATIAFLYIVLIQFNTSWWLVTVTVMGYTIKSTFCRWTVLFLVFHEHCFYEY